MLKNIRIVLVDTSHPGNIGATARAMKNMSLRQLHLVTPQHYPHQEATSRASGADDLLNDARMAESLDAALADCRLVVGTSARTRSVDWPVVSPREAAVKLVQEAKQGDVALVFGRERSGLTNSELDRCTFLVHIPTNEDYSSLNLAMAVQTVSYEVRMAFLEQQKHTGDSKVEEYPRAKELEMFYEHLEKVTRQTQFINKNHPGMVMAKLRRLFTRARPEQQELNILRGILSSVEKSLESRGK